MGMKLAPDVYLPLEENQYRSHHCSVLIPTGVIWEKMMFDWAFSIRLDCRPDEEMLKMQERQEKSIFCMNKACGVLLRSFRESVWMDYQSDMAFTGLTFKGFFRWSFLMSLCCETRSIDLTRHPFELTIIWSKTFVY